MWLPLWRKLVKDDSEHGPTKSQKKTFHPSPTWNCIKSNEVGHLQGLTKKSYVEIKLHMEPKRSEWFPVGLHLHHLPSLWLLSWHFNKFWPNLFTNIQLYSGTATAAWCFWDSRPDCRSTLAKRWLKDKRNIAIIPHKQYKHKTPVQGSMSIPSSHFSNERFQHPSYYMPQPSLRSLCTLSHCKPHVSRVSLREACIFWWILDTSSCT